MAKLKSKSSISKFLLKTFKSKTVRCFTVVIVLILATFGVFMLDEVNGFKNESFSFLESEFVLNFLNFFGIKKVNLLRGSWILYLAIVALITFVMVATLIRSKSLEKAKNKVKVNVIYGNNAQGKTNLLEAIWLFSGGHSFRGSKDTELINFAENNDLPI